MRKNKLLLLAIIAMIILSGCWNNHEPERMLYAHGLGIDFKENEYHIYLQIINFKNVARSDQPSNQANQSEVGFAKGKTMDEAFFMLYHSLDQPVYWGHLSFLIFSTEALNKGRMNNAIDSFVRFAETRYHIWLYSTEDPVKDILLTIPIINTSIAISKLSDPNNSYRQESYVKPTDLRNAIIDLDEPSYEVAIPMVEITENWETVNGKDKIASLSGVGILNSHVFKGFIRKEKAFGLQWISNQTKRGEITFSIGGEEEEAATAVIEKVKVKIKPIVIKDDVKFDVEIKLKGRLSQIEANTNDQEVERKLKQKVKKEIEETYREALLLDADIYRFSEVLYRKNNKEWKRLQKDGKIHLTEESIRNVHVETKKMISGRKGLTETIDRK